jgi:hypothetical protein
MLLQTGAKVLVEYRSKYNQVGLGEKARGYVSKSNNSAFHKPMNNVLAGDMIIHLCERNDGTNWFVGYSVAREQVKIRGGFYIVHLKQPLKRFVKPLSYDDFSRKNRNAILKAIRLRPHYQPFQIKSDGVGFRIPQGYYFGPALPALAMQLAIPGKTEPPIEGNGENGGTVQGGERSAAIWQARESPLTAMRIKYLEMLGYQKTPSDWLPDVFMRNGNKVILIEVKPEPTLHNMITAVGQIICYKISFLGIVTLIAARGPLTHDGIKKAMSRHSIDYLDLNEKWQQNLKIFLTD